MKREIAEKWVAALRSGEFKQGENVLRRDNEFCCLGVLCELHRREVGGEWSEGVDCNGIAEYLGGECELPPSVQNWAGMQSEDGTFVFAGGGTTRVLTAINDDGYKFPEIATLIEQHVEAL